MAKKSQITLFIILGIVMLVLILSIMYFVNFSNEQKTQDELKKTQSIPAELEPFVNYLETCTEKVAKEGFFLLGSQGGAIYRSQGGRSLDYPESLENVFYLKHNDKKVPYLIDLPVSAQLCSASVPDYPVSEMIMAYPYKWTSERIPLTTEKKYKQQNCFGKISPPNELAMLDDLKNYIEKHVITDCNFSVFPHLAISSSNISAKVISRQHETEISLAYPLKIKNVNTGTETRLSDFKKVLKYSLSELSEFTYLIMKNDVDDPTFDIRKSFEEFDFKVTVLPDVFQHDDIIMVTSPSFKLDGKEFKFTFARKNRPPALEYVYLTSFGSVPLEEGYQLHWNDLIHQDFYAVDPDEDDVSFKVIIGQGTYAHEFDENSPYTITPPDVRQLGKVVINISVSDGDKEDYQLLEVRD